ncbi:Gp37-like protein [Paenibacillus larvae]|uniref:Gp37-like protein n=1 Tax=Paenibacillus larvae TaxID=1464 RepID=UPI0037CC6FAC
MDSYTSLKWIRRWHKPGEVELRINPFMQNADQLQEDVILYLKLVARRKLLLSSIGEITLNEDGRRNSSLRGTC